MSFAFIVAFLGTLVFSMEDWNIDMCLVGVVHVLTTQDKSTLIPMIILDIFRALASCKSRAKSFEGCNLLLQIWLIEHLYHRPRYMNYGASGGSCIEEVGTKVNGFVMPEGVRS